MLPAFPILPEILSLFEHFFVVLCFIRFCRHFHFTFFHYILRRHHSLPPADARYAAAAVSSAAALMVLRVVIFRGVISTF
jgi:hypothetical protein